jgi:hypothetical protein
MLAISSISIMQNHIPSMSCISAKFVYSPDLISSLYYMYHFPKLID